MTTKVFILKLNDQLILFGWFSQFMLLLLIMFFYSQFYIPTFGVLVRGECASVIKIISQYLYFSLYNEKFVSSMNRTQL